MNDKRDNHIGTTATPSTTQDVSILVSKDSGLDPLKNQMIYFDVDTSDGETNRALGFVTEITTDNHMGKDVAFINQQSKNSANASKHDYRTVNLKVASTFAGGAGGWKGNKPLPTSPSSGTGVYAATRNVVESLFAHTDKTALSFLGHIRGASDVPAPLIMPYFGSQRGSSSSGILGRTGSGKTNFTCMILTAQMKYEDHAIFVIDPQGQWNNENGFTVSPKNYATALGREVIALRVAEDIQLELSEDNFVDILTQVDLWSKLGRMAKENRDLLSVEVAEAIVSLGTKALHRDHRELLSQILETIINSPTTIARIYASEDRQRNFRQSILALIDPEKGQIEAYMNNNLRKLEKLLSGDGSAIVDDDVIWAEAKRRCEEQGIIPLSEDDKASVETRWRGILGKFTPLVSLFMNTNLGGGLRKPLTGDRGFLTDILQVRYPGTSKPAPYVILDMSPDTKAKAKGALLQGADNDLNMRKLLDNDNIKATILKIVFAALKEASEEAFSQGGGNLNTQIVFDEAWRYAPESSDSEVIMDLSKTLEGFALDTRKFGIGWTYILQSPADLRNGIWKQLKFVYSGYGLVGADLKKLGDLMDDTQNQLKTYKQFVAPDLTNEYPFMITGSISPLITAQIPLFINAYTSPEEFLEDNRAWIDEITERRGLGKVIYQNIAVGSARSKAKTATAVASGSQKEYSVGNHRSDSNGFTPTPVVSARRVSKPEPEGPKEAVVAPF